MMEKIHLSDHFTFRKIFRFTISPILMMLFTSIYWIVDGFFISNYVGSSAFAGVNLIFPVIMIVACVGFMFGSGGAAYVSKKLGEQDKEGANRAFTLITISTFVIGLILTGIFFFLVRPIAQAFASINSIETTKEMIDSATLYGRIMIGGISLYIMQGYFHPFFSVNEKSFHGFLFTLVSGLTNMLLDYLLIGVAKLNVAGAAIASLSGMLISFVGPLIYFSFGRNHLIHLSRPAKDLKIVLKAAINGSSEFASNVAGSIINIVFNIQLLKYLGENGVSAYGIIAYVCFVFFAIFIGYSVGIAPVIGYNYGAKNHAELTNILRKSLIIVGIVGIVMTTSSIFLSNPFSYIFANDYPELHKLTSKAMMIYSFCYLFAGFSMFGSAFFTALSNGLISLLISFCRTLVFQLIAVFVLPLIMGVDGIWVSIIVAEFLSMAMTMTFMFIYQHRYGYQIFPKREINTI
ncbi:MAG: MATE family efflux transporter [Bacilli bacterium]|nr:MATE family efflux transporter [Bacilli bacterium]